MPPAARRRVPSVVPLATVLAAVVQFAAPAPASACSICRCGDPTFNALGKGGFATAGWRLAVDWERFDKSEGDPAAGSESLVENRLTTMVSYGFGDAFSIFVRVPYSWRDLQTVTAGGSPDTTSTNGFSDPEIYGSYRLWAAPMASGLGRRASLSFNLGIKTPWGQDDVRLDGVRVDEHAQPGTGATDVFGSLAYLYLVDPRSAIFVSGGYRRTGENAYGYRYGSSVTANVAYERKIGSRFDGVIELNLRSAAKDTITADGTLNDNSGGTLLYLTPRLLVDLGHGAVLRFAAQVPTLRSLNGVQTERFVANVGLTYLFRH
jgi:hypothetical protein